MRRINRLLVALLATLLLLCTAASRAVAEPTPDASPSPSPTAKPTPAPAAEDDSEVRIEPIIWLPTVDSSVTIGDPRFNASKTLNGTVTPSDVLPKMHFNLAGRIEGRDGRWGGFGEFWYLNASDGAKLGTGTGTLTSKLTLGQVSGFYRLTPNGNIPVDVVAGLRIGSISNNLQFNGAVITALAGGPIDATRSTTTVNPIIGLRAAFPFSKTVFLQVYGDYGGFGIGDNQNTWRAQGTLGFDVSRTTRLLLGYTAVNFSSSRGRGDTTFKFNSTFHGPVLGASFKL